MNIKFMKGTKELLKKLKFKNEVSIETNWISLYVNGDNLTLFDSFGIEYIPKWIKKFIGNKNITTNIIYRIKANDSIMCG